MTPRKGILRYTLHLVADFKGRENLDSYWADRINPDNRQYFQDKQDEIYRQMHLKQQVEDPNLFGELPLGGLVPHSDSIDLPTSDWITGRVKEFQSQYNAAKFDQPLTRVWATTGEAPDCIKYIREGWSLQIEFNYDFQKGGEILYTLDGNGVASDPPKNKGKEEVVIFAVPYTWRVILLLERHEIK